MTCLIMHIEKKLDALGLTLMDLDRAYRANTAGARFVSDLSVEQGYEAARYALLSSLAAIKYALGDLDRVQQAVQLIGFVNSAPGFSEQPRVINGATDLLVELYGDRGKPTRAAIGCQ